MRRVLARTLSYMCPDFFNSNDMKRLILMLALVSVGFIGSAQKKETRQERVERWKNDMEVFQQRRMKSMAIYDVADSLEGRMAEEAVRGADFVLEADAVTFRRGNRVQVNSTTNFISVKGDRAVVQVSPSYFYAGPNGVGGVTVDGVISGVSVTSDKRGNIRYSMNVTGVGISARVDISIRKDSPYAYAVVIPNFSSNSIRLDGRIVPYSLSRVVEGTSL